MKVTKILLSEILVSVSVLGLGILAAPVALKAESTMPPGYTLSKTPIPGQHCYYHGGGHVNYYCYTHKLDSAMQNNSSMQHNGSMQNNGSMQHNSSMQNNSSMQHNGSMQNNGSMQHNGSTMKGK
ncbi:MAG: hypothetical protein ACRDEA_04135 [Microcystaceae cyanobacterium]